MLVFTRVGIGSRIWDLERKEKGKGRGVLLPVNLISPDRFFMTTSASSWALICSG